MERFARAFALPSKHVLLGIGDDAAVLAASGGPLVWTIDDSVEGVHFDRAWMDLGQAAARAFEAALSDLAAMGARPLAALSSLQVSTRATPLELERVRRAQARCARRAACPIIGGNVTRARCWRFSTTLLGEVDEPVLRSVARPGHRLWVLGPVGLAGCGRAWLERGFADLSQRSELGRAVRTCVEAFLAPRARVRDGLALDGKKHAAIDVSDGLATECRALARASGVQVVLDRAALEASLSPALERAAAALGRDAVSFALTGGEDYALLVAGPAADRPRGGKCVGEIRRGRGARLLRAGTTVPLVGGFDHLG